MLQGVKPIPYPVDAKPPTTGVERPTAPSVQTPTSSTGPAAPNASSKQRPRSRRKPQEDELDDSAKRRCVSTACIACRKRKSKCDGNTPACAACSQVYGTECIYDPNSDHRRKGVYKNDTDNLKTRSSTLHTLIEAILNYPEDEVPALVREIRTCESLDAIAERIAARENGISSNGDDGDDDPVDHDIRLSQAPTFESHLYGKMGDLRLDDGSVRYIGGTSNLIHLGPDDPSADNLDEYPQQENPITSWTNVTDDPDLVVHLTNMYFTWHYTFFTTLSKKLYHRDFLLGKPPPNTRRKTPYCTPLLVNAILALGCHFTSHSGARDDPNDSATAGDHFFREAKRLIMENDEHEKPLLTTVQALALMSVREAGCGREARGWVYSGMSFRMACDMGLNLDSSQLASNRHVSGDESEEDVRRITFWGCYLFDKCWSNYLGRLPQLPTSLVTVSKFDVFPDEDADQWSPYTDSGFTQAHAQPARTRAVALQMTKLCEISNDLMKYFYNPIDMEKTKGRAVELRKLSDIHTRLETWRRELPPELEPKEGGLSSVLVMHMYFQLLFIHLFRPILKYNQATSPLPPTVSPRKLCTQAAAMISKLMRLYKRSHGLRQICNIAVYIAHSACTIHLLNLPDKNAKRDITHGVKHLEEIAEGWPCARRSLGILSVLAERWDVELPEEAALVLARTDAKFGAFQGDTSSPSSHRRKSESPPSQPQIAAAHAQQAPWPTLQTTSTVPAVPNGFGNMPVSPNSVTVVTSAGDAGGSNHGHFVPLPPPPPPPTQPHVGTYQPSHFNTADHPSAPRVRTWAIGKSGKASGDSPSEMFGGVEQLIRDSNDWTFRDQAQLATGFGNWTSMDLDMSSGWGMTNGGSMPRTVRGAVRSSISAPRGNNIVSNSGGGNSSSSNNSNGNSTNNNSNNNAIYNGNASGNGNGEGDGSGNSNGSGNGSSNGNGHPQALQQAPDGQGIVTWLTDMNPYNSMAATYDETEWYQ